MYKCKPNEKNEEDVIMCLHRNTTYGRGIQILDEKNKQVAELKDRLQNLTCQVSRNYLREATPSASRSSAPSTSRPGNSVTAPSTSAACTLTGWGVELGDSQNRLLDEAGKKAVNKQSHAEGGHTDKGAEAGWSGEGLLDERHVRVPRKQVIHS
jgi:hypothetical protein